MQKRWILLLLFGVLLSWLWRSHSTTEIKSDTPLVAETNATPALALAEAAPTVFTPTPIPTAAVRAAPSRSAMPNASPSPDSEPLWLILQRNELCRYLKLNPEIPDLGRALLQTSGAPPQAAADVTLQELFDPDGPFSGKINPQVFLQTEPTQFYSALLAADLLAGQKLAKPNWELAESLFLNLEQLDPQNAAYPFFHAALLQKIKSNSHEIEMALLRALHGSHFEIDLDEIESRFYERGSINPTAWVAAKTLNSRLPAPLFAFSQSLMIAAISPNEGERAALEKFGRLLTQKYKSDLEKKRSLLPHRFENDAGLAILASIHVSSEEPKEKKNERLEQEYNDAYAQLKSKDGCDPTLFTRVFYKIKSTFVR